MSVHIPRVSNDKSDIPSLGRLLHRLIILMVRQVFSDSLNFTFILKTPVKLLCITLINQIKTIFKTSRWHLCILLIFI